MPLMPCEIKGSLLFSIRPVSKVQNSIVGEVFFAIVVIGGNKLLMSDVFRVYDHRWAVSV